MLSSLPTELIRDIIESAIPHTFHTRTYKDRQKTLCSLSLVSKLFRSIAQPLLLEIASIENESQLGILLTRVQQAGLPEMLVLNECRYLDRLDSLLPSFRSLQALTICRDDIVNELNLNGLCDFPNLTNLQLCGAGFVLESPRPLSSLRSLSLNYEAAGQIAILLDAEVVPSLRTLGLSYVTEAEELKELKQTEICNLLPQIDSLFVHQHLYVLTKDTLLGSLASRILVDAWPDYLDLSSRPLSTAHHLRIRNSNPFRPKMEDLSKVSSFIHSKLESKSHHLRSLYFDTFLHPSQCHSLDLSRIMNDIVAECEKRDIEVVFEMQDDYLDLNPYISEEFSARQRKRRLAETGGKR